MRVLALAGLVALAAASRPSATKLAADQIREAANAIRFRARRAPLLDQDEASKQARDTKPHTGANAQFPAGSADKPHESLIRHPGVPGASDANADVTPLDAIGGNLEDTHAYAAQASYQQNLKELVRELDDSEEQARTLRLKLMEKDNLLGTMLHREKIIDIDLGERKQELAAINAHIQGIEARVDRLKKERRSMELTSQKHQYDSAANTLKMQVNDVQQVSSALESRVQHLNERITRQPHHRKGKSSTRRAHKQPLLSMAPESQLAFPLGPDVRSEARLLLTNPHSTGRTIAFKVKTNAASKYRVGPSLGILSPGQTASVRVLMSREASLALLGEGEGGSSQPLPCKDKFLVMSVSLHQEDLVALGVSHGGAGGSGGADPSPVGGAPGGSASLSALWGKRDWKGRARQAKLTVRVYRPTDVSDDDSEDDGGSVAGGRAGVAGAEPRRRASAGAWEPLGADEAVLAGAGGPALSLALSARSGASFGSYQSATTGGRSYGSVALDMGAGTVAPAELFAEGGFASVPKEGLPAMEGFAWRAGPELGRGISGHVHVGLRLGGKGPRGSMTADGAMPPPDSEAGAEEGAPREGPGAPDEQGAPSQLLQAQASLIAVKMVEVTTVGEQRSLEREIRVLRALRHPNIVRYLGTESVGPTRSSPLPAVRIYMEFATAGSVAHLVKQFGPLPEPAAASLARQLLEALAYCHAAGIAHRDVKGANVLVTHAGVAKLGDFGACKLLPPDSKTSPSSAAAAGGAGSVAPAAPPPAGADGPGGGSWDGPGGPPMDGNSATGVIAPSELASSVDGSVAPLVQREAAIELTPRAASGAPGDGAAAGAAPSASLPWTHAALPCADEASASPTEQGTVQWMAPEVVAGSVRGRQWLAADVWSVGCTVVEMLSGKPLWDDADNAASVMMAIASRDAIKTAKRRLRGRASPRAVAFVAKCLVADLAARPTVADLLRDPFAAKAGIPPSLAGVGPYPASLTPSQSAGSSMLASRVRGVAGTAPGSCASHGSLGTVAGAQQGIHAPPGGDAGG
ncbi:hypothetical protein FNF27_00499 [Cafeteria roenbergensis]|uniref:Protein kinase domain-containing protein n=1 Tax=Cafeteria roenbergensis TaxID=33653 RepID=A0A5A8EQC2_CAFRO|nr:hypothetical protein FNF27_00499 [Cafeteria roenbergensis]